MQPLVFAELAEKAVSALGWWPRSVTDAPMLERRLAACLHAALAHPKFYSDSGGDAALGIARIYDLWQHFLRRNSEFPGAAVPPCLAMEFSMTTCCPHTACRWQCAVHTLLKGVGLGLPAVDPNHVFRHNPAKNIQKASLRFLLIRQSPLFHGMELGQTCTHTDDKLYEWILQNHQGHDQDGGAVWGPEGRLFMLQRHFDDYNRTRLALEDPQALRWRPEKLLVDCTSVVTAADWKGAFCAIEAAERDALARYRSWHRKPRSEGGLGQPDA